VVKQVTPNITEQKQRYVVPGATKTDNITQTSHTSLKTHIFKSAKARLQKDEGKCISSISAHIHTHHIHDTLTPQLYGLA